ncbi:MAG: TonB-dependent receptor plug domain-containing protein [Gemmatimonadaceae bacterium]
MRSISPRVVLLLGFVAGVVTGCGSSRAARPQPPQTGMVTAEDIERSPDQPIEQVLQAKVPGVWVTRTPDGGIAVQIRGTTSILGSNAPLYVIDGVAIQPGPGGALNGVNPYDIESIEVLKNPADTAMYGMRGANGVIVVKTKKPKRR